MAYPNPLTDASDSGADVDAAISLGLGSPVSCEFISTAEAGLIISNGNVVK